MAPGRPDETIPRPFRRISRESRMRFARTAELNRLVEDHPDLVNSKPFVGMLTKELGDAEASSLIRHADMVAARRAGKASFQVAH